MDVIPFKGYRYDAKVVGDVGWCLAPPYDVIDPDQQLKLYEQSEYNIARIIKPGLNGSPEAGVKESNPYTGAAEKLVEFMEKGALKQDEQECLYVYVQDFTVNGKNYRRSGFVGLGKLEEYGGAIKPHEQTLLGPKADRLNLMRATDSQIGQIFMLYSDPTGTIDAILAQAARGPELLCHTDEDNVVHRLYAVSDPEKTAVIIKEMKGKNVFIADGHHRYETALNYYRESNNPAAQYQMMTFVNTGNEGLLVLPTHRLIKKVVDFNVGELLAKMNEYFDVARMSFDDVVEKNSKRKMMFEALSFEFQNGEHALGMYFNDGAYYVATLRDVEVMETIAKGKSQAWRQLDVSILHTLILEKMLGIDEEALAAQANVEYIKDFGEATLQAVDKVDAGEGQGLFFMNPTRADEVEAVAMTGEKMPQKSTFFYPKIFSGLVLRMIPATAVNA